MSDDDDKHERVIATHHGPLPHLSAAALDRSYYGEVTFDCSEDDEEVYSIVVRFSSEAKCEEVGAALAYDPIVTYVTQHGRHFFGPDGIATTGRAHCESYLTPEQAFKCGYIDYGELHRDLFSWAK